MVSIGQYIQSNESVLFLDIRGFMAWQKAKSSKLVSALENVVVLTQLLIEDEKQKLDKLKQALTLKEPQKK